MNINRLCVFMFLAIGMAIPGDCRGAAKRPGTLAELAFYKGADRQQILEEGARKEGKLLVYTTGTQSVAPVAEAFQKKYPFVKVETWRTSSGPLIARATEEFKGGNYIMDVMDSSQISQEFISRLGMIQSFFSPNFAFIDDEAKTIAPGGKGTTVVFRSYGIGFGYNTKKLSKDQLPKSYQDLADPKWKGKLAIAGSNSGASWVRAIQSSSNEEVVKKIAAQNFPIQMISAMALVGLIESGEYAGSPTLYDANIYGRRQAGAPVDWVALEPAWVNADSIGIAKNAPHPCAALLYADFEYGKEAGEIHRSFGYNSFRKDVAPVAQRYKKYFGNGTMEEIKEGEETFQKLFVSK